jgi:3-hydroxyacyl-[acyl-carrier-protein] dehydratase
VRFLFFDRILELEPGRRALAVKSVSLGDGCFGDHYPRAAIMPATLLIESLAQVAGWLHIVTNDFAVRTVLGLVEGVTIYRHAVPGDRLLIEARTSYAHHDGATIEGEIRVEHEVIARVERMLFASERLAQAALIERGREMFHYVSGGFTRGSAPPR